MVKLNQANIETPIDQEILDTHLRIAFSLRGMNRSKDRYQVVDCTVQQLLNRFFMVHRQDNEKDGQHILQGSVVGANRSNAAVDAIYTLQLDLDCGDFFGNVVEDIRDSGLFAVVYTTHSDQKPVTEISKDMLDKRAGIGNGQEATLEDALSYLQTEKRYRAHVLEEATWGGVQHTPMGIKYVVHHKPMDKLRVMFVLNKPFVVMEHGVTTQASKEWASYRRGLEHKFNVVSDRATKDLSRLFYTPSHPAGSSGEIEIINGRLLDLSTVVQIFDDKVVDPYAAAAAKMGTDSEDYQTEDIMKFYAQYGHRFELKNFIEDVDPDGRREGRNWRCPFDDEHSDAGNENDQGFFAVNASENEGGQSFAKCMHDSCSHRDRVHFTDKLCVNNGKTVEDLIAGYVPLEEGEGDTPKPRVSKRTTANPDGINEDDGIDDDDLSEEDIQTSDELKPYKSFTEADRAAKVIIEEKDREKAAIAARRIGMTADTIISPVKIGDLKKRFVDADLLSRNEFEKERIMGRRMHSANLEGFDDDDLKAAVDIMLKEHAWLDEGKEPCVLVRKHKPGQKNFELKSWNGFKMTHKGNFFNVEDASGNSKKVYVTDRWIESDKRKTYTQLVFEPPGSLTPVLTTDFNMWSGFTVKPKRGEWNILRQHMFDNMCGGNQEYFDFLFMWLADLIQSPGRKRGSSLVLRGERGTGKTKLFEFMRAILGVHAMSASQVSQITGAFNAHQKSVVLLIAEEAVWAQDHTAQGVLKDLITGDKFMVTPKGVDSTESSNHIHVVFLSNSDWVVPASIEDERRFFCLNVSSARKQDTSYFGAMTRQMFEEGGLEAMLFDLSHWQPTMFAEGWDKLRNPPKTEALMEQALQGLTSHQRFASYIADSLDLDTLKGEVIYTQTPWDHNSDIGGLPLNIKTSSQIRLFDLLSEFTRWAKYEGLSYIANENKNKIALGKALQSICGAQKRKTNSDMSYIFPPAKDIKMFAAAWRGDTTEDDADLAPSNIDERDSFQKETNK